MERLEGGIERDESETASGNLELEGEVCRKMNKKGRLREMKLLLRIFF